MLNFLQLLKFPLPNDIDGFTRGLLSGNRNAIYPILHYILPKLPVLKKRAYVAKYLVPIEVPAEFAHDEAVAEMLAQYRELQLEFKETHKLSDKATGEAVAKITPSELRKEMTQLEDERSQLIEKITGLKKKTTDVKGFAPLLTATSNLRKEQEEETKLMERMQEQRAALSIAERRYTEINRKLAETRASIRDDITAEAVLESTRKENYDLKQLLRKTLPHTLDARRETLHRLHTMLQEPVKSEQEFLSLKNTVHQAENTVNELTQRVAAAQRAAGDDKLAMFRQQGALIAKKVAQKEEALEIVNREAETLSRELETRESKLNELSGPKFMRREEFKAYAAQLRNKTATFKQLKQDLGDLRQETVVLAHTETLLRGRAGDMDTFLRRLEEKKGISGYMGVQTDLEKISALKARIDESKGATLTEISRIVDDINRAIKEKKTKLAPAIQVLRNLRTEYSDIESAWLSEKAKYDSVAAGLETEKMALERTADNAQSDYVSDESRIAMLQLMTETTQGLLDRAKEENAYEKGEGRYLRDFKTIKESYNHKLSQLELLAKELRKKQKDIKENSTEHIAQRNKFMDIKRLLEAKTNIYRNSTNNQHGLFAGSNSILHNSDSKSNDHYGDTFTTFDLGSANVMTITQ